MQNLATSLLLLISLLSFGQETALIRTFGGPYQDYGSEIIQTSDGGYAIIGTTGSYYQGNSNMYLIKLDANLEKEWTQVYGGNNIEWGKSLVETDSGYLLLGFTNSFGAGGYDAFLVKCDFTGEMIGYQTYGGEDWDFAHQIVAFNDTYMIVGETWSNSNGGSDAFVVQIDAEGNQLWSGNFGGTENDYAASAFVANNAVHVVGTTHSFSEKSKVYMLEIDVNMQVTEHVFGNENLWYEGTTGIVHGNGNYYISGSIEAGNFSDYLMLRLNSAYELVEVDEAPLGGALTENAFDIIEITNQQMVLVGRSDSYTGSTGAMFMRLTEGGSWMASPTFGDSETDIARCVILNSENELVIVGETDSYGAGNFDVYLVKLPNDQVVQNYLLNVEECFDPLLTDIETISQVTTSQIYPNPAIESVMIKTEHNQFQLRIINSSGQIIANSEHNNNELSFSTAALAPGVYLLQITSAEKTEYLRLVKE